MYTGISHILAAMKLKSVTIIRDLAFNINIDCDLLWFLFIKASSDFSAVLRARCSPPVSGETRLSSHQVTPPVRITRMSKAKVTDRRPR